MIFSENMKIIISILPIILKKCFLLMHLFTLLVQDNYSENNSYLGCKVSHYETQISFSWNKNLKI